MECDSHFLMQEKKKVLNGNSNLENGYLVKIDDKNGKVCSLNDEPKEQQNWANQCEFILSCVGFSVGLGNIWRFPYLCIQNGGAAFLIPYFLSLLFCGMPLYFLEICIGQFSGFRPLKMWNICPIFKGLGYAMIITSSICNLYYNVIIAWTLYYLFKSFAKELPWATCGNWWNTPLCLLQMRDRNSTFAYVTHMDNGTEIRYEEYSENARVYANLNSSEDIPWKSPADEFWHNEVLGASSGIEDIGGVNWQLFGCLVFAWGIIFLCFVKGIQSMGKVVYITATAPYILLTILLVRGLTLPGAIDGIKFYVIPDFNKLLEVKVWAVACLQVFYSLGPAWGAVITMASYNKFNHNCIRDGIMIPIVTGLTSFYGGITLFSIVGFMAYQTGHDISYFVKSGPGLAFIAYPEALTKLPISPLWATLFFLMIFTVGLDSMFVMIEIIIASFAEQFPRYLSKHKLLFTAFICFAKAVAGIIYVTRAGIYIFQVTDWFVAAFSVMLIAILECLIVSWIYGHERFYYDIELITGRRPSIFWKICWGFVTPAILLVLLIYSMVSMQEPTYGNYIYPRWFIGYGWFVALISLVPIPVFMLKGVLEQKGTLLQRIKKASQPSKVWGPSDPEVREIYKFTPSNCKTIQRCIRSKKSKDDTKQQSMSDI